MTAAQVRRFAAISVVLLTVACGDGSDDDDGGNPLGPGGGTGVSNNTDDFQFFEPNVTNYSTNGGYTWRNTGTSARVTQSSSLSSGNGTLIVRDAGGRIVYQRNLTEGGTATSESGPTGEWRIEVAPANVTGTINFRVQRN